MSAVEPLSVGRLLAQVAQRSGVPLGLVVHVGAGPAALEDHAETRAKRLVLVEGDPDTASGLEDAAQQQPAIEVVAEAVAPAAGALLWRRYNLTTLNGPLDASALRSIYPRLREVESLQRASSAFDAVLQRFATSAPADAANVLMLDVPGQEHGLLCSAAPASLRLFQWIVVRGSQHVPGGGGDTVATTRGWLSQAHFPLVDADDAAQGIWVWSLHRFDADAQKRDEAKRQLAAAQSRSSKLEEELDALKAERQVQIEAMTKERSQITSERDVLEKEKAGLVAACDELRTQAIQHQAQIEALTKARAQLTSERDALVKEKAGLVAACDELRKQAAQQQAQVEALTKVRAQLTSERDVLAKEKAALVAARDEQTRAARDAKQRAVEIGAELADTGARYGILQEELVKAEAQIELIADLLLRDPHR